MQLFYIVVQDKTTLCSQHRNPDLDNRIYECLLTSMTAMQLEDVNSSMARSFPLENLLPQNVGSIINYLQ